MFGDNGACSSMHYVLLVVGRKDNEGAQEHHYVSLREGVGVASIGQDRSEPPITSRPTFPGNDACLCNGQGLPTAMYLGQRTRNNAALVVLAVMAAAHAAAQNLVPNGDLEQYTVCPTTQSQIDRAAPWFNAFISVPNGPGPTPDYFNACAAGGMVDVPTNNYGPQDAFSGDAYAGLVTYMLFSPQFREYLQVQLVQPLVAGECYRLSMRMSLAEQFSNATTDGIGAYFSNGMVVQSAWDTLPVVPQIDHLGAYITDSIGWVPVSDIYVAQGGEEYLTLGNFRGNANTGVQDLDPLVFAADSYVFIDSVALQLVHEGCGPLGLPAAHAEEPLRYDASTGVLHTSIAGAAQLVLYDAMGRTVLSLPLAGARAVPLTGLRAGAYSCTVLGQGRRQVLRWVVH